MGSTAVGDAGFQGKWLESAVLFVEDFKDAAGDVEMGAEEFEFAGFFGSSDEGEAAQVLEGLLDAGAFKCGACGIDGCAA